MSEIKSKRLRSKKKKMKKLKKFLLTSKKCWVMGEKLLPFYHLVDDYSVKLREEWTVKVEEMDVEVTPMKEEPQDDNLVEPQSLQVTSNTTNGSKVIHSH